MKLTLEQRDEYVLVTEHRGRGHELRRYRVSVADATTHAVRFLGRIANRISGENARHVEQTPPPPPAGGGR